MSALSVCPLSDPLAWVAGTSSIVYFETDIFPGLCITEENPGLYATAYGMLADFIRAVSRNALDRRLKFTSDN